MRVLITGGYGFIGSFVADRFYQEGHQVTIIDDLSSGKLDNFVFPHKSYRLGVENSECEEVFKNNEFDAVVHLAAQINVVTSLENPYLDAKSNVLGLNNMLHLSAKYKVKKFIFASSAAVYGMNENAPLAEEDTCNPMSPYGINKYLGEYYCKKWTEMYGLDTLCFRFSNVFGPRQGVIGEGGVISIFLERLLAEKELYVYGDGEQTRDFIYVEDVANAIYQSVCKEMKGVFNLSTNTENSVNQLIEILNALQPVKEVIYRDNRKGDIARSSLNNNKIKQALNWKPDFSLEVGLARTYDWFKEYHLGRCHT